MVSKITNDRPPPIAANDTSAKDKLPAPSVSLVAIAELLTSKQYHGDLVGRTIVSLGKPNPTVKSKKGDKHSDGRAADFAVPAAKKPRISKGAIKTLTVDALDIPCESVDGAAYNQALSEFFNEKTEVAVVKKTALVNLKKKVLLAPKMGKIPEAVPEHVSIKNAFVDNLITIGLSSDSLRRNFTEVDLFDPASSMFCHDFLQFTILMKIVEVQWKNIKQNKTLYAFYPEAEAKRAKADEESYADDVEGLHILQEEAEQTITAIKQAFPKYQERLVQMLVGPVGSLGQTRQLTTLDRDRHTVAYLRYTSVCQTSCNAEFHRIIVSHMSGSRAADLYGMKNVGNTCWLNTVLQTLISIEDMILDSRYHSVGSIGTEHTENYDVRSIILTILQFFMIQRLDDPKRIESVLELFAKALTLPGMPADLRLESMEQQDCRAFLNMALNAIGIGFYPITCRTAGTESATNKETNLQTALQIAIGPPKAADKSLDLTQLIEGYFAAHLINDRWRTHAAYTINNWIETSPPVLVIDLERLYIHEQTRQQIKNDTAIAFPQSGTITLKVFDAQKSQAVRYAVVAFTRHTGTAAFGHWTACRLGKDRQWRRYDDDLVPKVLTEAELARDFAGCSQVVLKRL